MNKHISCRSPLDLSPDAYIPISGALALYDARRWRTSLIDHRHATQSLLDPERVEEIVFRFAELVAASAQNPLLFHHQPLDYSRPCIRLLNILPRAEVCAPICCEIRNVSLPPGDSAFDFTALSYAWGATNSPGYDILIDGMRYSVRKNLYDFLCQHGAHGVSNLWVDSICIN